MIPIQVNVHIDGKSVIFSFNLYLNFFFLAKKPSKEVDLFGDGDDDDDDDSLFSAKPAKKEEEPKSQPSKRKVCLLFNLDIVQCYSMLLWL